ncbi:hypothetical protein WKU33_00135 [Oceanobacillus sp. HCA-5259]|uniref:hypothetical protein n=1 Tax=Oceanobacillus sp. HCA-5259 TaxID=3134661 RepID=UPI0030BF058F
MVTNNDHNNQLPTELKFGFNELQLQMSSVMDTVPVPSITLHTIKLICGVLNNEL